MTGDERAPVTVLGLGAMGRALAGAFLAGGRPTTVWNRSAGRADPLVANGAVAAATAGEAVAASQLVVVCVLDNDAVREVLDPCADLLAGRTVLNLTNGTPRQARRLADRVAGLGADYLDGGIMAVPPMIGAPEAVILYSGSPAASSTHHETIGALGTATYLGSDAGHASLYDIALLSAMYGMLGGYFHAVAMTRAEIRAGEFTPMVSSWLTAMLAALPAMAEAVDSGDHAVADSNLRMQARGWVNLVEASADQAVSTELLDPMGALIRRGVAEGHGGGAISSLVGLLGTGPAEGRR